MSWKQFRGLVVAQSQVPSRAVRSIDNEIRGLPQRDRRARPRRTNIAPSGEPGGVALVQ
jgi:hypothetical protein